MILQALYGYYERKAADPDEALAPEGWIARPVDYRLVLNREGAIVDVECLQVMEGSKAVGRKMVVPAIGKQALKHTNSGSDANLLWDNTSFVFGLDQKGNKTKADRRIASFLATIDEWFPKTTDPGIIAVRRLIERGIADRFCFDPALTHPEDGPALATGSPVVSFRLEGDKVDVFLRQTAKRAYEARLEAVKGDTDVIRGICLVSGQTDVPIERSHTVIKGIWGGQSAGGAIVSFNKESFVSYGKEQSYNAPVGKVAAAGYVKALNHLLNSDQCVHVGDASIVFWADTPSELERLTPSLFEEPPKDDPDRGTKAVSALYDSIQSGRLAVEEKENRFHILGLAPNAARISIRFWETATVTDMAGRFKRHFEDLVIVRHENESPYLSLLRLLRSTALLGKLENISPRLGGETMRSILTGGPYPAGLLQAAVRRVRAEQWVDYPRAALIKACINRNQLAKELTVSLDESNTSPSYLLGRLFAVLERVQEEANPGTRKTIRNTYWSAASSAPGKVFPLLVNLATKHLSKIRRDKPGRAYNLNTLIGAIMEPLDASRSFPATLAIADQGAFIIGYYHQRIHPSTYRHVENDNDAE